MYIDFYSEDRTLTETPKVENLTTDDQTLEPNGLLSGMYTSFGSDECVLGRVDKACSGTAVMTPLKAATGKRFMDKKSWDDNLKK